MLARHVGPPHSSLRFGRAARSTANCSVSLDAASGDSPCLLRAAREGRLTTPAPAAGHTVAGCVHFFADVAQHIACRRRTSGAPGRRRSCPGERPINLFTGERKPRTVMTTATRTLLLTQGYE